MKRLLQLVWILALYSITVNSVDLKSLFNESIPYTPPDHSKLVKMYNVQSNTKIIAVKCYSSQPNRQEAHKGIDLQYNPDGITYNLRQIKNLEEENYVWVVSPISNSGKKYINCGELKDKNTKHPVGYNYIIPSGDNTNKLKEKELYPPTGQNYFTFHYSESTGLRDYDVMPKKFEGDITYVFKVVDGRFDQVLEPDYIIKDPSPHYSSNQKVVVTAHVTGNITDKNDKEGKDIENSTDKIGAFSSIIFSIMFILNRIIH
uniref:Ephrin RBD domain-containing protein n=1 Tax=Strongyloides papillosus TaxID=174720 RepID=A0A0N5BYX5_STREA